MGLSIYLIIHLDPPPALTAGSFTHQTSIMAGSREKIG